MRFVFPGYFETRGTRLVAGRPLTWQDVLGYAPVVTVSERLARELWRSPAAALGKRVRESARSPWREVIGVVGDERADGLAQEPPPIVYYPALQKSFFGGTWSPRYVIYLVRSPRVGSASFTAEIQRAVWSVHPDMPLARVQTLAEIMAESMAPISFALVMLAIAASVSLMLGVVGVYGVIAYMTAQRSREIGIRLALGATPEGVAGLFVGHGLRLAGMGIAVGICAAIALSRLIRSTLFGVSATDPLTYGVAAVGLAAVAGLAAYLPSRRAARTDPVESLRTV